MSELRLMWRFMSHDERRGAVLMMVALGLILLSIGVRAFGG